MTVGSGRPAGDGTAARQGCRALRGDGGDGNGGGTAGAQCAPLRILRYLLSVNCYLPRPPRRFAAPLQGRGMKRPRTCGRSQNTRLCGATLFSKEGREGTAARRGRCALRGRGIKSGRGLIPARDVWFAMFNISRNLRRRRRVFLPAWQAELALNLSADRARILCLSA